MPSVKSVFAAAALLAVANAKTVKITAKNDDRFDPDSTTADKGDVLEFHFEGSQHSVVAGDYDYPCSPLQLGNGFFSGIVSGSSGKIFRVQVNNSETIAFYSSQGNDCASGMVGIVNPSSTKTLDNYKGRASKLSRAVSPGNTTFGGELSADEGSSDDSKDGNKSDKKDGKDDKGNSAGMLQVSTVALAGVFVAALYML